MLPQSGQGVFLGGEVLVVGGYAGVSDEESGHASEGTVYPPVTGHFLGRVLRESSGRGNSAMEIQQIVSGLAPVGDRLTGRAPCWCFSVAATSLVLLVEAELVCGRPGFIAWVAQCGVVQGTTIGATLRSGIW